MEFIYAGVGIIVVLLAVAGIAEFFAKWKRVVDSTSGVHEYEREVERQRARERMGR